MMHRATLRSCCFWLFFGRPRREPGYVGKGCATCDEGHAMEDGSVLSCGSA